MNTDSPEENAPRQTQETLDDPIHHEPHVLTRPLLLSKETSFITSPFCTMPSSATPPLVRTPTTPEDDQKTVLDISLENCGRVLLNLMNSIRKRLPVTAWVHGEEQLPPNDTCNNTHLRSRLMGPPRTR